MKKYLVLFLSLSLLCVFASYTPVFSDSPITVRVGIYENKPKIFTDDKGNASGFWPDIIEYIASQERWKIDYIHGTWEQCLDRLEKNEIDMMPDVAYTEERNKLYDFSNETVYSSWSLVYTRKGIRIESVPDLGGKNIAVLKGAVNVEGPQGIKELVRSFGVHCTFTELDTYIKVFELVASGEADAGVTSKDFGYRHEADFNIQRTPIILTPALLYFAFPKESSLTPYLIQRIDYHVKKLKEDSDSIYYQALRKWFGTKPIERPVIPDWVRYALLSTGALVFLLGTGSLILRSQVRSKTKELRKETTERKLAEKKLIGSERKYRMLFENSLDAIHVNTLDGRIIEFNQAMLDLFGYTKEELLTTNIIELYANPADRSKLLQELERRGAIRDYELKLHKKDGTVMDCLVSANFVVGADGEILGIQGATHDITERKRAEMELERTYQKLRVALEGTIHSIVTITEMRDPYTAGHQRGVAKLASSIAEELGLSQKRIEAVRVAGLLHDIGKVHIPAEILSKPGRLRETEMSLVRAHPQTGREILKTIEFPWPICQIVHQHHERMDGSGYPSGLSDEDICLEARILAVADVVEAMSSHRPYRPALGIAEALKEISEKKGVLYDSGVVDACLKLFVEKGFQFDKPAHE